MTKYARARLDAPTEQDTKDAIEALDKLKVQDNASLCKECTCQRCTQLREDGRSIQGID